MEILLVLLVLALIFGGGFVLRLIGLALGVVVAIVLGAAVIFLVVVFAVLT